MGSQWYRSLKVRKYEMKIKIWTGAVTLVLAVIILKYYAVDPGEERETWQSETADMTEAEAIPDESMSSVTETAPHQDKISGQETENASREDDTEQTGKAPETSENVQTIHVLIKNDNLQGIFHENPQITCDGDFSVCTDGSQKVFAAGETVEMGDADEMEILPEDGGRLLILNLERSQEQPAYPGKLKLYREEGGVVVINELPLEEYLPAVLSSEMSASFPEEALEAQAICARTYAMKKIQENRNEYYGADLDDSVSYQVYNNIQESEETRKAVRDTEGLVLADEEGLADVYYYSTSCGVTGEDNFSSEQEFRKFIETVRETDMEQAEVWYRWQASIASEEIRQNLMNMLMDTPETVTGLKVVERSKSGQALRMVISGPKKEVEIIGEYDIRRVLAPGEGMLTLQDGSGCDSLEMLPSAWFVADEVKPGEGEDDSSFGQVFLLTGGGYGHGNGLSQNGARLMAAQGKDCGEILEFYYPDKKIVPIGQETEKEQGF